MSEPPRMYTDLILIPAILHIEPLTFAGYPPALQMQMRGLLRYYIAGGWAGNTEIVRSNHA